MQAKSQPPLSKSASVAKDSAEVKAKSGRGQSGGGGGSSGKQSNTNTVISLKVGVVWAALWWVWFDTEVPALWWVWFNIGGGVALWWAGGA